MNVQNLENIIKEEQLNGYIKFLIGGLKIEENSVSISKCADGSFTVRKVGERGMRKEHTNLSEDTACKIFLEYLRGAKFLEEFSKNNNNLKSL